MDYQQAIKNIPDISMDDVGGSAVEFSKNLDTGINNAFGDYLKTSQAQEKPLATYSRLESEANIPELRKTASTLSGQVNDVEDTMRRVEGDISARSQNSFMTEAQRRQAVTAAKEPLTENLGWLSQSLGRVQGSIDRGTQDIGTKVGLALQGNQMDLEPYKMKIQLASDSAARSMTGFTSDRQTRLDILTNKMQMQQQLTIAEIQEAGQLLQQEKSFQNEKSKISSATQIITQNGRQKMINSQTGQVIADLGPEKAPSTNSGTNFADVIAKLNAPSSSSSPVYGPVYNGPQTPTYKSSGDWTVNTGAPSASLQKKAGF